MSPDLMSLDCLERGLIKMSKSLLSKLALIPLALAGCANLADIGIGNAVRPRNKIVYDTPPYQTEKSAERNEPSKPYGGVKRIDFSRGRYEERPVSERPSSLESRSDREVLVDRVHRDAVEGSYDEPLTSREREAADRVFNSSSRERANPSLDEQVEAAKRQFGDKFEYKLKEEEKGLYVLEITPRYIDEREQVSTDRLVVNTDATIRYVTKASRQDAERQMMALAGKAKFEESYLDVLSTNTIYEVGEKEENSFHFRTKKAMADLVAIVDGVEKVVGQQEVELACIDRKSHNEVDEGFALNQAKKFGGVLVQTHIHNGINLTVEEIVENVVANRRNERLPALTDDELRTVREQAKQHIDKQNCGVYGVPSSTDFASMIEASVFFRTNAPNATFIYQVASDQGVSEYGLTSRGWKLIMNGTEDQKREYLMRATPRWDIASIEAGKTAEQLAQELSDENIYVTFTRRK